MFDIGWSELLVIGVVAIVVVGPKDLPRMMRAFGAYTGKARRMAADFQRQFEEAVRDTELEDVRKAMQEFRSDMSSPVEPSRTADKPLMLPKQAEPVSQPDLGTDPQPKPKRKPRARAKPKSAEAASSKPDGAAKPKKPAARPRKARKPREPQP